MAGNVWAMLADWDHNAYYHRVLLRRTPRECRRALDVGCGAGAFTARLADALRPGGVLAVVALPRSDLPRELPVEAAASLGTRLFGAAFQAKRLVGGEPWFAKEPSRDFMTLVLDPPLGTRQVARQATAILPGVRVRRLLLWRYLLVWQKDA